MQDLQFTSDAWYRPSKSIAWSFVTFKYSHHSSEEQSIPLHGVKERDAVSDYTQKKQKLFSTAKMKLINS